MSGRTQTGRQGFSLVEMLVVLAITSALILVMIKVAGYVITKARERNTESTIKILCSAMEQYREINPNNQDPFPRSPYWYGPAPITGIPPGQPSNIAQFMVFLLPPNSNWVDMNNRWLGVGSLYQPGNNNNVDHTQRQAGGEKFVSADTIENYREANLSIEVLYYTLMQQAESADLLKRLPVSSTANYDKDEAVAGNNVPLIEVIDAWKIPLRYRYMGSRNFPLVSSAGPDGRFDTADDILSKDF
jgi:prepilin-type N-terminal cleavage/methylation domain-containing protein